MRKRILCFRRQRPENAEIIFSPFIDSNEAVLLLASGGERMRNARKRLEGKFDSREIGACEISFLAAEYDISNGGEITSSWSLYVCGYVSLRGINPVFRPQSASAMRHKRGRAIWRIHQNKRRRPYAARWRRAMAKSRCIGGGAQTRQSTSSSSPIWARINQ